jgi:coniferyl-aldehyde dehydrogenase
MRPNFDAPLAALSAAYQRLRRATDLRGTLDVAERRKALKAVRATLISKANAFAEVLNADFRGRSRHESLLTEVSLVVSAIDYTLPRLERWARPTRLPLEWPHATASARLIKQPRGIAGIIGPSNYPLQLALMPLIGSLSAGCRTILKPSEAMPGVADLLQTSLGAAVDPEVLSIVCGGPEVAAALTEFPLDVLLFTGSHKVGLKVAEAAAARLTPLLLELGGKSPVIIDRSADLGRSAEAIAHGKLLNAGQTCVAPDYVLVPRERFEPFAANLKSVARQLYPDPMSGDYTAIRSDAAIARLRRLEAGQDTVSLFASSLKDPFYDPKLVLSPSLDSEIMREEIFGPLLPLLAYDEIDDALAVVKALPLPLVLYWFGGDGPRLEKVIASTSSGAVSVNETVIHAGISSLPLGGVGASGLGRYHGKAGFDSFTHERPVFRQARFSVTSMMRPPYGSTADRILNWLLR